MKINAKLFLISLASAISTTAADEEIPLCLSTLRDLCSGSSTPCGECARENEAALLDAGCTEKRVQLMCRAMSGPGNMATCRPELDDLCPVSSYPVARDCLECAQANTDDLIESECTMSLVGEICKERTGSDIPVIVPETILPTGATESNPLRVFLQAGQSGCVGQASVPRMNNDTSYEELQGVQEGVWFAGIKQGYSKSAFDPSHFFISPMLAGEASRDDNQMGPEVAIGRRLYDAEGGNAPVMIIKYCWGGSNLAIEWNPDSPFNSWDKDQDDGTAEWLLNESGEGGADLGNKKHLYANLIYTVRRSLELLDEAEIPYELSGMFWLQGAADKKRSTWKEYGDDTVTFFEAVRTELGEPSMPIVDDGSSHPNIQTGKVYAASVIDGCNTVVPNLAMGAPDPDDTECTPGAGNACPDSTFINYEVLDYYGYDPAFNIDEFASLIPPGAADKNFYWFKSYPTNNHMEYEGKILQGRMMANAYIRSFTDHDLTEEWIQDDPTVQFPFLACDPNVNNGKPGPGIICWMDQREAADYAEATCPNLDDISMADAISVTMSLSSGTTSMSSNRATMPLSFFSALFFFCYNAMSY